jgi:hypothetical protein
VLDKNTQAARACRLRYPFARDACLRAYDWNFAAACAPVAAIIRGRIFRCRGGAHVLKIVPGGSQR